MIPSIARLGIELGKLATFDNPSGQDEQYATPCEIAGEAIHYAAELGDISGKEVSDLGAGTGILGIGALLCGASKCTFVEQDSAAANILQENARLLPAELQAKTALKVGKIQEFGTKSETIIMNPPFGTKQKHADKAFFEKAFTLAPVVYAFAKTSTARFVESISADHAYKVTHRWTFPGWRLKKTQKWHKKPVKTIEVTLFRLEK